MRRTGGFTLLEILVVVGILAILASTSLLGYRKAVERTYWRTAQDTLRAIYAGEQVYWTGVDSFIQPTGCAPAWQCIGMDNPNNAPNNPTQFVIDGATVAAFRATAARGDGRCMSIDQANAFATNSGLGGCTTDWSFP